MTAETLALYAYGIGGVIVLALLVVLAHFE